MSLINCRVCGMRHSDDESRRHFKREGDWDHKSEFFDHMPNGWEVVRYSYYQDCPSGDDAWEEVVAYVEKEEMADALLAHLTGLNTGHPLVGDRFEEGVRY